MRRTLLLIAALGSLLIFVLLELAGLRLIRHAAEDDALSQAGAITADLARVAFDPYLSRELLAEDPEAIAQLDNASAQLLDHGKVEHIKIWERGEGVEGRVVWSDEHELIGQHFPLDPDEIELFNTMKQTVGVSDLSRDENALEAADGTDRSLEVYVSSQADDGTPILVETYSSYDLVRLRAAELRSRFVPPMTIVLAVLAAGQVALFWMVGRRLNREQRRRTDLLERLIQTSDTERRRVAAEVHDGVVQDLMGISFALAGAAQEPSGHQGELRELAGSTRNAVGQLRSLLTSIYPTEVPAGGWLEGLDDPIDVLRAQGVRVDVDVPAEPISAVEEIVVLRIAREALRNTIRHARARHVAVELSVNSRHLRLVISDDGVGFDPGVRPDEHFGLRLMSDLADDAGGVLRVDATPGGGTAVRFEMGRAL